MRTMARRTLSSIEQSTTTVKVVVVGDSGVGKTSLVVRYAKGTFNPFQEPTIGAAFVGQTIRLQEGGDNENGNRTVQFKIWDTAGQERYHSLTPLYFRGAGAAILVFDICRYSSFQTLCRWILEIRKEIGIVVVAVVGNKADLEAERSIQQADAEAWAEDIGAQFYMETSAKNDTNVTALFRQLAQHAADKLPPDTETQTTTAQQSNTIDFSETRSSSSCSC